jgi:hypothetical protein
MLELVDIRDSACELTPFELAGIIVAVSRLSTVL